MTSWSYFQKPGGAMKRYISAVLMPVLLGLAAASYAHHSFPAHYFADRTITIEGSLTEYLFRNPHSFLHMEVMNDDGEVEIWAAEWGNTLRMTSQGYTPESFEPGDLLIVSGNPSRDAGKRIRLVTLERPADGLEATRDGPRPSN